MHPLIPLTEQDSALPIMRCDAVVVGSGAAAWNAALTLRRGGADVRLVTEGVQMGTSRNTGSDKQTYYKLATNIHTPDCAAAMAQDLFSCGSMHGDLALTEAMGSLRGFYHLVSLGVPFPHDRYGEYTGYRTDHDTAGRATSCGPLTSKYMTEALEGACRACGVPICDGYRAVHILTEDGQARGIVCLAADAVTEDNPAGLAVFLAGAVVWATGGPSSVYDKSVYPESQTCGLGAPLLAGASASNLTESQYGIASLAFRWNLSGSYQQVIPRYISVDANGRTHDFLADLFDTKTAASLVFLKGYEWPFDPDKIRLTPAHTGSRSSEIDIAVYREIAAGRRVYLDYRTNPVGLDAVTPDSVGETAYDYLENCEALGDTPIKRLRAMNERAYRLYLDHGIDLEREPLEIAVCAQHLNGGLSVTVDYESPTLGNFYPVGECAGVFGIKRPGGSALNSTQVGSLRAAETILRRSVAPPETISPALAKQMAACRRAEALLAPDGDDIPALLDRRVADGRRQDACAAFLRDRDGIRALYDDSVAALASFGEQRVSSHAALVALAVNYDTLVTRCAMLSAIGAYIDDGGLSRGSYQIVGRNGIDAVHRGVVLETVVSLHDGALETDNRFVPVRPIPDVHNWFETVYNAMEETR